MLTGKDGVRQLRLVICGLMLCCCFDAPSAQTIVSLPTPNTVRIAAEDNWPPFSDERGEGLSRQLVETAFKSQGYAIETLVVPYARALHYTEHGTTDAVWNLTRQQSTEQTFLLHQLPLFQATSSFYYQSSTADYQTVADIPDKTVVGVIIGYEYGDLYEQHKDRFRLVAVSTHPQLIALLADNKIDLAIFFDDVLRHYQQQMPSPVTEFRRGQVNHQSHLFVGFDKNDPQSAKRAAALDRGLRALQASGDYQRLLSQYLGEPTSAKK